MIPGVRSLLQPKVIVKCSSYFKNCLSKGSENYKFRLYSSYLGAKRYDPNEKVEFEVSKDPKDWSYVTRLLPPKIIPEPNQKDSYPSGWRPQDPNAANHPYFVCRSKNHMQPVYLHISFRGTRKITVIRHIRGDIWMFAKDLIALLKEKMGKEVGIRVDEVGQKILLRGDYVIHVQEWLTKIGF